MASLKHDFIVAAISRKIRELGFRIICVDGRSNDISKIKLAVPPKIINHKPDLIGENNIGNFCIGEAKTLNDLKSARTKRQIYDFHEFTRFYTGNFLIIGIPLSAESTLEKLLNEIDVNPNDLIVIKVPEELLPSN